MGANAQTTVPSFVSGQTLLATQVNQINTGVPVASGTATRDGLFGGSGEKTLAEGQLVYVESLGLQSYNGTSWVTWGTAPSTSAVVQVKSTAKTDTFTTTSGTFTDVTGLSVSITPTSASNKILVMVTMNTGSTTGSTQIGTQLVRDSTAIAIGDTAGNRTRSTAQTITPESGAMTYQGITFLDSPATTSATTYKIQIRANVATNTVAINRSVTDTDVATQARAISTITVFEVTP